MCNNTTHNMYISLNALLAGFHTESEGVPDAVDVVNHKKCIAEFSKLVCVMGRGGGFNIVAQGGKSYSLHEILTTLSSKLSS